MGDSRYDKAMSPEEQERLVVVLVRARNPSNIGAVARAMHDFGFAHLRVVSDYPVPFEAAQLAEKAAVHAFSVLEAATQPASLAEAIADCTLVLGTTAVGDRVLEHPLHTLAEATIIVQQALAASPEGRVAVLFGSEKTGLSNEELSHCHALLTIPMNTRTADRHLSMNLGQAAAVCLYSLSQDLLPFRNDAKDPASPAEPQATAGELERLTVLLTEVFNRSGYARRHPANSREPNLRRLVRRMANAPDDATVWSGVLRQILHALKDTNGLVP